MRSDRREHRDAARTAHAAANARATAPIARPTAPTTYEGALCSIVTNLVLTIGAVTYPVESLASNSGWALTEIRTGTAAAGTLSKVLLSRPASGGRMTGSLRLVDGLAAYQDAITLSQGAGGATLSATITDGTRTTTITAPALQFGNIGPAAEGVMKFDCPFYLNRGTSGDDELVVTLT